MIDLSSVHSVLQPLNTRRVCAVTSTRISRNTCTSATMKRVVNTKRTTSGDINPTSNTIKSSELAVRMTLYQSPVTVTPFTIEFNVLQ